MITIDKYIMRKSLFLVQALFLVLFATVINQSCTKLDETLYSEVTPDNFFNSDEEFVSALGAAYTQFGSYASGSIMDVQEQPTDEIVVPTRGQDWDDGGEWRRLHLHSWTNEDSYTGGAWDFCFSGVNTANRLIFQFQSLVQSGQVEQAKADAYVSELQAVRGFFYWQLIDVYGNVPLVTDFENAEAAPPTKSRTDVFNFVVSDLETAVPKLSDAVDGTTYGRMNYYAGQTLLAKLYLNAGVYTGTTQWNKVITACDEVINSGKYSLESNYFANFDVENSGSSEFIFAIPYDQVFFQGFQMGVQTLHYASQYTYNLTQQPWNGYCTLEEFYNSYDDADVRQPNEVISLQVTSILRVGQCLQTMGMKLQNQTVCLSRCLEIRTGLHLTSATCFQHSLRLTNWDRRPTASQESGLGSGSLQWEPIRLILAMTMPYSGTLTSCL